MLSFLPSVQVAAFTPSVQAAAFACPLPVPSWGLFN